MTEPTLPQEMTNFLCNLIYWLRESYSLTANYTVLSPTEVDMDIVDEEGEELHVSNYVVPGLHIRWLTNPKFDDHVTPETRLIGLSLEVTIRRVERNDL